MVDRVELVFRDQPLEMRNLDRDDALRRPRGRAMPATKSLSCGTCARTLLAAIKSAWPCSATTCLAVSVLKNAVSVGNAPGASRLRHVGGRLDTKHPLTEREKMLQEIAVVAAELDDEAVWPKIEPRLHHFAIALGVCHPARRVGREISIFGEDVRRTHELGQLHEPACIANADMEGIIGLRLTELLRR